jgi:hypothetical protein
VKIVKPGHRAPMHRDLNESFCRSSSMIVIPAFVGTVALAVRTSEAIAFARLSMLVPRQADGLALCHGDFVFSMRGQRTALE